jgi:hypothetical protein
MDSNMSPLAGNNATVNKANSEHTDNHTTYFGDATAHFPLGLWGPSYAWQPKATDRRIQVALEKNNPLAKPTLTERVTDCFGTLVAVQS